jgi:hypothetical protein
MENQINANTFLNFKGWDTFRSIHINTKVITGFSLEKLQNFKLEDKFFEICNKFINDPTYKENKILLNKLQIYIISKGYEYTTTLLIKLFHNHYINLYNEIQELINQDDFTVNKFNQMYTDLNNKLNKIKFLLSSIDYSYKNELGKRTEHSFINLIKNYVSYNVLINSKYDYNTEKVFLYELFIKEIEHQFDTETILDVFRIYDFYNKFSYAVKNKTNKDGIEYFNSELSKKILLSDDIANRFLTRIIEMINKKIIDLAKNENLDTYEAEKEIKYIRRLIDISPDLCNKNLFMIMYKKALTERLLIGINPEIENEFLKSLNPQNDIDIYIKMKNQINDFKLNPQHNKYFVNLKVGGNSEKYKNIDITKYDRKKVTVNVCRSYDWDYENFSYTNYNLPLELSIYTDIFGAYYKDRFNERQLGWDYDKCIGVIEFDTDKHYNVKMNLLQMAVFYSLNNSAKSPNEISIEMKINLADLTPILNSLLISKLVYRELNSEATNPDVKFYINDKFAFVDSNISVVSAYEKLKKMHKSEPVLNSNLPSITLIRAKILAKVIIEKSVSKDKVIDDINNYFNVSISAKFFDGVFKEIVTSDSRITINGNIINFNNICHDEDLDSDEDDGESIESVESELESEEEDI